MSPIDSALHELAGIRSGSDPVVTVYLDTKWADEHQRERVRVFVRERIRWARGQALDKTPENLRFQRTLDRVETFIDEITRQAHSEDANGVAIFACEGLGLWRTMLFGQRFRQQFSIAEAPQLLQLARLADDFEPVIVALVDGGGARVFESALGEVIGDSKIEHTAPSRHKMGGWSQLHFQRHVRQQIERNQKEAAEHVTFLFDEDPSSHVILVGPDRILVGFEQMLPQRVRDRILCRLQNPRERSDREGRMRDQVMAQVMDELAEYEQRIESHNVEHVVSEALAGGLGVLGPEDVVLAVNEGRVHRLIIEDTFDQTGWRCKTCDAVGMAAVTSCGYCGNETTTVNLGEELARRVLGNDGEIEVLQPRPLLHHYHGIAAVLRHRRTAQAAIGYAMEQPVF